MKFKKKELTEIIDSNGELIGKDDIPKNGADMDSAANGTTDKNAQISTQPFRYDMLGRFGFTLMPFMEGKEMQDQSDLLQELASLMHQHYAEILERYFRNPNLVKPDYRKSMEEGHGHDEECEKRDIKWANEVLDVVKKSFEGAVEKMNIDEAAVVEDKMIDKKSESEMSNKKDDEIKDKKIEAVAGLINKMEKKDKDKLMNLLERK